MWENAHYHICLASLASSFPVGCRPLPRLTKRMPSVRRGSKLLIQTETPPIFRATKGATVISVTAGSSGYCHAAPRIGPKHPPARAPDAVVSVTPRYRQRDLAA